MNMSGQEITLTLNGQEAVVTNVELRRHLGRTTIAVQAEFLDPITYYRVTDPGPSTEQAIDGLREMIEELSV